MANCSFWATLRGKKERPSPEAVEAVQAREVAEAARQRLHKAIEGRKKEVHTLVDGVLPERRVEQ